jgi:hypothetical protein
MASRSGRRRRLKPSTAGCGIQLPLIPLHVTLHVHLNPIESNMTRLKPIQGLFVGDGRLKHNNRYSKWSGCEGAATQRKPNYIYIYWHAHYRRVPLRNQGWNEVLVDQGKV